MQAHATTLQNLGHVLIPAHQLGQSSTHPDRYWILQYCVSFYPIVCLAGEAFPSACILTESGSVVVFSSESEARRYCTSRNRSEAQRVRHASRRSVKGVA